MKTKLFLALAAMAMFLALPAFGQHGGHGGGSGSSSGHGGDSMHGSSHGDDHDSGKSGHDHDNDANEKHGSGHDHGGSVAAKLAKNTALASKLQALLPPGTDLQAAAAGFKNLGQFVAAVHVSKNLGIPFDQLKAKMTGPNAESLGKAIQQLAPNADAKAALKTAEAQAKADLKSTHPEDNDKDHDALETGHDMDDHSGKF